MPYKAKKKVYYKKIYQVVREKHNYASVSERKYLLIMLKGRKKGEKH